MNGSVTVVETNEFQRRAKTLFLPEDIQKIIEHVAYFPTLGVVMPGTGGVRKLRWAFAGKGKRGRGSANKNPVLGIKERRSGQVRMQAVRNVRGTTLSGFIRQHSAPGSEIHTDEFKGYLWLDSSEFPHRAAKHRKRYVDGQVHVNGVENLWSLFKRGVMGSFHKVSEKYLPLYLSEFEFRFNHRKEQGSMFDLVLQTSF